MVKSPNQSGCDNVRFSRPSELEGQLKDFSTPLKLLETNEKAQLECVSATSSACTSAGYSKVSGLGNQTTQMNMSFIQVSPPSSSVNTVCQGSSKRSSRDKLSKVKTAMPLSTKPCTLIPTCKKSGEPLVLDCRSSLSSYPLRALKSVPLYSEHGFKSAPLTAFKKRLKDNQCETLKRIDIIEAEHSISPINCIPDEILCEIFSYVPLLELVKTCQKVCRRWHSVVRSPPLWRTLNFKGRETPIQIVEGLTRFLPGCLRSISIEDRYDIGFILPILHQQCKLLESIKLVRCRYLPSEIYLHAKHLYPILRKRQLRSLNLERTIYKSRKFYKSLSEMPNLEELIVSSSGITPQILTEIAYSSSLKVFKDKSNLSLYPPLRRNEWDSAYSLLLPILGPNLTTLEFNASFLKDLTLSSLAYCKNLKNLAVYSATSFGRKSMSAVSTLTGLQELLIHCSQDLTTSVVASAFSTGNMRGLKGLYLLNNCLKPADDCVQTIASECQSLQHFSFTHSSSITDDGVDSVLSNCKQLLSLDFSDCCGISGQSFLSIPTSTPSLKLLVIERKCSFQKKAFVESLANYGVKIQMGSTYEF